MSSSEDAAETTSMLHSTQVSGDAPPFTSAGDEEARWMTPRVVLLTFTALNFLLYFDRGAIAGALSSIRVDHALTRGSDVLSDAKSGFLVSGFTIGYLFTSPFFASRGSVWGSRVVILVGMLMWCITCLGSAAALNYGMLLFFRILVGVGEAAFVGFTVTIIDNIAPPAQRTSWIGFFYSMIPVGTAVGMGLGGVLTSYAAIVTIPPWRFLFVAEVVAALPVIVLLCCIPARYHLPPAQPDAASLTFVGASLRVLRNGNYLLLVFGFSTYCFVTGAVSTWGILLLHEGPLGLSSAAAAVFMGLATTLSGVVGSLIGGLVVDWFGGSTGLRGAMQCQKFNVLMIVVAIPCGAVALASSDVMTFGVAFIVAVVALFAITAPINAALLTVVPAELRPYAVSYSVFFVHLLGDFPSPTLTGVVSDYLGRRCRNLSEETCRAQPAELQCAWVTNAVSSHCTNRLQLRNALMLVFTYLFIAPPCWGAVWWRLRREVADSVAADAVVVESSPNTSPPHTATEPSVADGDDDHQPAVCKAVGGGGNHKAEKVA